MKFILGFKGVFLILYCINLLMIFNISYEKGGFRGEEVVLNFLITLGILVINIFLFEKIKNNKVQPFHLKTEYFLSVCRILMVCFAIFLYGLFVSMFSPSCFRVYLLLLD